MRRARTAIEEGRWPEFRDQFLMTYRGDAEE